MRRSLCGVLVAVGLLVSFSAVAQGLNFQDPPPEQSLVSPGDEPKQQPEAQRPVQQPVRQQAQVQRQPRVQRQAPSEQDSDNAFYLKPTYVSQEAFNTFKRQVVEVLKDANKKSDSLSQQVLDMKIQVQHVGPQMNSLKQMMTQIATLVSAQAGGGNIWLRWWFLVLLLWSVVLTILAVWALCASRRKKVLDMGPDSGGDYDYMSKSDSLPSHLNLAQTYITMNDYAHARKSLEFVIMNDKGELKAKAMQLLKQLPRG